MRLLIVAGFLGSGKTTLLLQIARRLTAESRTVAIVENEVGEVGVDGAYLSKEGLQVQELFGGCICCTLSVGLIETLHKVEQLCRPDWTIVEPTGVAWPGDLLATLQRYAPEIADIQVITLVDATRYQMLAQIMSPMLTAQIEVADVLAINKIDAVDRAEVERISCEVRAQNAGAKLLTISAERAEGLEPLLEGLL